MKFGIVFGIICAVLLHVGFILFGGLLVPAAKANHGTVQQVELLSDVAEEKKDENVEEPPPEELQAETEEPPDGAEILENLETPPSNDAPALEAASLSAIEAALSGMAGGRGDFSMSASLEGGGVIGGKGKAGAMSEPMESAFSMSEIDQQPRVVHQASPMYPSSLRGKKIEGVVSVIFIVDPSGKVVNPRVERSNNTAFEKPALDAVKKWKFEPGVKGGQRVACKMRAPLRFPPS